MRQKGIYAPCLQMQDDVQLVIGRILAGQDRVAVRASHSAAERQVGLPFGAKESVPCPDCVLCIDQDEVGDPDPGRVDLQEE